MLFYAYAYVAPILLFLIICVYLGNLSEEDTSSYSPLAQTHLSLCLQGRWCFTAFVHLALEDGSLQEE